MTDCKEFTDLHTGKKHKYSEEAVNKLKAKYEAAGVKRVTFFKQYCVLGQIGKYKDYLKENDLAPAKKAAVKKETKVKSPAKKIPVAKKATPAKVETKVKVATQTKVKATKSPAKKIPVKAASPTKAKVASQTKVKKSPPKKIAVTCLDKPCPDDKMCRVKTGNCVAKKLAAEQVIVKKGRKFLVATESQKKKVASALASKSKSSASKSKSSASKSKSSASKSKSSASKSKSSSSKKTKSPPKKIAVTCLDKPCPVDKMCRVKTGNCVTKKLAAEQVATKGGRKFLYTTESQKRKIGSPSSMKSAASSLRESFYLNKDLVDRTYEDEDYAMFDSAQDDETSSVDETSDDETSSETSSVDEVSEDADETSSEDEEGSDDMTTLSASDQARLNTNKDVILGIIKKCKQD